MCGIAGIMYRDPRRVVDLDLLTSMARSLAHRGPDDESIYTADGVGLAMRRLSIIDIAGGHQPLSEESGQILVMQLPQREVRPGRRIRHATTLTGA